MGAGCVSRGRLVDCHACFGHRSLDVVVGFLHRPLLRSDNRSIVAGLVLLTSTGRCEQQYRHGQGCPRV